MIIRHKTAYLTLNNQQPVNRNNTCLSSYSIHNPNYALSNFAKADSDSRYHNNSGVPCFKFYDPDMGDVFFPTAEHYLHFQQLSATGKRVMLDRGYANETAGRILAGKLKPGSPWNMTADLLDNAIKTNGQYDDDKWTAKAIRVQMQINATKYQQSKEFRDCIDAAIALGNYFNDGQGAATIIEDTASKDKGTEPENKWGTGPRGEGTNLLGVTQTAFANMISQRQRLKSSITSSDNAPAINLFDAYASVAFNDACDQFGKLRPVLMEVRKEFPNAVKQPDTTSLGFNKVRVFENIQELELLGGEVPFVIPSLVYKPVDPPAAVPAKKEKDKSRAKLFDKDGRANSNKQAPLSKQKFLNKKSRDETPDQQADRIFKILCEDLKQNQGKKICLLFAANDQQAKLLHHHNSDAMNSDIPKIGGTGQAEVFSRLITLINANKMQKQICISPIATSLRGGNDPKQNQVSKVHIDRDINNILYLIDNGWTVYGMPRVDKEKEYSIGGGNSTWWVTDTHKELGGRTQNAYLQAMLKRIEAEGKRDKPNYDKIIPVTNPLVTEIEAHIKKLEAEANARILGERRRHKIDVLKAAMGLIKGENGIAELNDAKKRSPKWNNAIGSSDVVKLVERAIKYHEAHSVTSSPLMGRKL